MRASLDVSFSRSPCTAQRALSGKVLTLIKESSALQGAAALCNHYEHVCSHHYAHDHRTSSFAHGHKKQSKSAAPAVATSSDLRQRAPHLLLNAARSVQHCIQGAVLLQEGEGRLGAHSPDPWDVVRSVPHQCQHIHPLQPGQSWAGCYWQEDVQESEVAQVSPTAAVRPHTAECTGPWQCSQECRKQSPSPKCFSWARHNCHSRPSEHGAASLESFAGLEGACSSLQRQCSGPDLVWADAPLCLKAGCRVRLHPCHQCVGLSVLLGRTQQLQAGAQ